jgi:hypothetical protein
MREPLFAREYAQAAANRYRFAWVVATETPKVAATDVDRDLVFLAARALDKDWQQRSRIPLEDFLLDSREARRKQSLKALGLRPDERPATNYAGRLERIASIAKALDHSVHQYFSGNGVRTLHTVTTGRTDFTRVVTFKWDTEVPGGAGSASNEFSVEVSLVSDVGRSSFQTECRVKITTEDGSREAVLALPRLTDELGVDSSLANQVEAAFEELAQDVQRSETGG